MTKLLPTRIATINLSSLVIKRCTDCARLILRLIILRSRILLKDIIEVSETENKKETMTKAMSIVRVNGEVKILYICIDLSKA